MVSLKTGSFLSDDNILSIRYPQLAGYRMSNRNSKTYARWTKATIQFGKFWTSDHVSQSLFEKQSNISEESFIQKDHI